MDITSRVETLPSHLLPQLVPISDNLIIASFETMKRVPAHRIVAEAEASGELKPGGTIVESSSGTFALALAEIATRRGYQLVIVTSAKMEPALQRRLRRLGATIDVVEVPATAGGSQQARLARLADICDASPGAFWPNQYGNPFNPLGYWPVADYLLETLGPFETLIGPVGTGGSTNGLAHRLRQLRPMCVIGVDLQHSATFGQTPRAREMGGAGSGIIMGNVDETVYDLVSIVHSDLGFIAARQLEAEHGFYGEGTTGIGFLVARWWAQLHPHQLHVLISPDKGYRYEHNIYSDDYLGPCPHGAWTTPHTPTWVSDPRHAHTKWTVYPWRRRTLEEAQVG